MSAERKSISEFEAYRVDNLGQYRFKGKSTPFFTIDGVVFHHSIAPHSPRILKDFFGTGHSNTSESSKSSLLVSFENRLKSQLGRWFN